jgi:peptide-methionine (R)-S-oxide reductase
MPDAPKTTDYKGRPLSPLAVEVTQRSGTERAFTGTYTDDERPGTYRCIVCGIVLFDAAAKFHSGCGWPSFDDVKEQGAIKEIEDNSLGMRRVEVRCGNCDAHLGHVFPDGPTDTGLRYCINSVAIDLDEAK